MPYREEAYIGDSASEEYDRGDNELTSDVIVSAASSEEYERGDKSGSDYDGEGLATWRQVRQFCCGYSGLKEWLFCFFHVFSICSLLYLFFAGMDLLASSAQIIGGCYGAALLTKGLSNPISSVMAGIIATSLFQSSTAITYVIGSLVGNGLTVQQGIYMAMGANVGNTMTNCIFALVHIRGKSALERAIAGASVNDVFYLLTIAIVLPLEMMSKMLYRISVASISSDETTGFHWKGLIQWTVAPLTDKIIIANEGIMEAFILGDIESCEESYPVFCDGGNISFHTCNVGAIGCDEDTDSCPVFFRDGATHKSDLIRGTITLSIAIGLILLSLSGAILLINKMLMTIPIEVVAKLTNLNSTTSMISGCAVGLLLGNSSITESILTPFVGTGVVELEQMFPWSLGANIGLCLTTILAALSSGSAGFVQVALANLLFNVIGILVWFPIPIMRTFPLHGALVLGIISSAQRVFPIIYICVIFFGVPFFFIGCMDLIYDESKGLKALGFITIIIFFFLIIGFLYWWFRREGRDTFLYYFNGDNDEEASFDDSISDDDSSAVADEEHQRTKNSSQPPPPAGILRNRSVDPDMIKQKLSAIGPKSKSKSKSTSRFKSRKHRKDHPPPPPRPSKVCCTETGGDPRLF